jgi:hypothetical protein
MLRLTLAAGHYDRTEALRDGRVRPEGIELTYLSRRPDRHPGLPVPVLPPILHLRPRQLGHQSA